MARLRGKRWMGDAIVNGERKRVTFETQAEAERYEADPYATLKVDQSTHTVGTLFPKWTRELYGHTKDERNAFRISEELVRRLGPALPVTQIDRKKVKALVAELEAEGNSRGTINTKTAKLSKLLNYGVEEEVLETVPSIPFYSHTKERIRTLSKDEERAMFNSLSDPYRWFAEFLLATGCRSGEAIALQWSDISADSVTFWRTKTDKPRTVPLIKKAKEALAWAKLGLPIPGARSALSQLPRVTHTPFKYVNYHTFINEWNRGKATLGFADDKEFIPYALRHTCATRLAQGGMSELRLMQWMGHSSLNTTKRYTHLTTTDLMKGVAILEA